MTLSKIAKAANVSISTASKAFSMSNEINEQTREQIFNVAKEYGCFKKFFNAKYPKLVIAVICPEFESRHYTEYLSHLHKYLEAENCEVCVATTNFSKTRERELLEYYYRYSSVDGIIVIGAKTNTYDFEIPVVAINPTVEYKISVSTSLYPALEMAVRYLLEKNVSSVGFIGEKLTTSKLNDFEKALNACGIPFDEAYVSITDKRFEEGGYEAMQNLIENGKPPRAVICAYDYMAIGAMKCAKDNGYDIPRDISILGMDNIAEAKYMTPPLASIAPDIDEMCRFACSSVLNYINGTPFVQNHTVATKLYFRDSFKL